LGWNNLLNAVEVDIIGIAAKIDMINKLEKKYQTEERPFGGLIESLRKMQMAEENELPAHWLGKMPLCRTVRRL